VIASVRYRRIYGDSRADDDRQQRHSSASHHRAVVFVNLAAGHISIRYRVEG